MTLRRSNPDSARPVIDRTDDSAPTPARVAIVGDRSLFLDVLIEALATMAITAWRVPPDSPSSALLRRAELVLVDLGGVSGREPAWWAVRQLAAADIGVIVLEEADRIAVTHPELVGAARFAVDPATAGIDELVAAIATTAREAAERPEPPWDGRERRSAQIISFDDASH